MARKTSRQLTKILRDHRVTVPAAQATFRAAAVPGDKGLKFKLFVTIDGTEYEAASNSGKVQTFGDMDAVVKFLAGAVETSTGTYNVPIETGVVLVKPIPADLAAWAAAEVERLGVRRLAQVAVGTKLDNQLELMEGWETGNALQQAKQAEVQAQQACVVGDIAAIDAEIVRLTP